MPRKERFVCSEVERTAFLKIWDFKKRKIGSPLIDVLQRFLKQVRGPETRH